MTTKQVDREVAKRLEANGVRYTRGRSRVVSTLANQDGPRSASELHSIIGSTIPLSSLYRTLAVLVQAGVVAQHFSKQGVTRYEMAEWLKGHHHHLVCTECGTIEDISLTTPQEKEVHRVVEAIAGSVSFVHVDHTLEIEGRCQRCQ